MITQPRAAELPNVRFPPIANISTRRAKRRVSGVNFALFCIEYPAPLKAIAAASA